MTEAGKLIADRIEIMENTIRAVEIDDTDLTIIAYRIAKLLMILTLRVNRHIGT